MTPTSLKPGSTASTPRSSRHELPSRALEDAIIRLGCVPLKRYCEITKETANAVYQRKRKKVWLEGVHLHRPEGSDWWVDLAAVRSWVLGDVVNVVAEAVRVETLERQAAMVDRGDGVAPDLAARV